MPLRDTPAGLEVLMLRRNRRGAFGGMWVFPGGQVDEADRSEHAAVGDDVATAAAGDEIAAARVAAVREAREEADIELDGDRLVVLSFWMPPVEAPRRFSTWFFLASLDPVAPVVVDDAEIREHRWVSPAGAMDLRDGGEWELAPPTYVTLWWLSRHATADEALDAARRATPERYETHIAAGSGIAATLWAGDAGYEDRDLDRPGPRRRLVMDPSGWRVEISL